MRLIKLTLHNYCQYEDTSLEISDGLTALRGLNGVGKSNCLNSIFFALTGESYLEGKSRPNMLKWGTDTGYVSLDFAADDGAEYNITRDLHKAGVKLTGEGINLTKSKEASKFISELIHVDADVLKVSSFMPQDKAGALIFGTQSERQTAFSRLFNLLRMDALRALILKEINTIPQYPDVSDLVEQLKTSISGIKMSLSTYGDMDKDASYLEKNEARYQAMRPFQYVELSAEEKATKLALAEAALLEATAELGDANERMEALPEPVVLDPEDTSLYSGFQPFQELCAKFVSESRRLAESPESIFDSTEYDSIDGSVLQIKQKQFQDEKRLALLLAGKCDKCGSEFPSDASEIDALRADVSEATEDLKALGFLKQKLASELAESRERNRVRGLLEASVATLEKSVSEKSHIYENYDPAPYLEEVGKFEAARGAKAERDKLQAEINAITRGSLTIAERAVSEIKAKEARPTDYSKEFMDEYAITAARHQESLTNTAALKAQLDMFNSQLDGRRLEEKRREVFNKQRALLSDLRDMLHVGKYPRLVIKRRKDKLAKLLNKYLEIFEIPFTVKIDDSLEFLCAFADNPNAKAIELSGGQKAMLLVSCRLAVAELLAKSVGVLAFDEPGAALDIEARVALVETFELVRKYLSSQSTQILVASHDDRIEEVADSVARI